MIALGDVVSIVSTSPPEVGAGHVEEIKDGWISVKLDITCGWGTGWMVGAPINAEGVRWVHGTEGPQVDALRVAAALADENEWFLSARIDLTP